MKFFVVAAQIIVCHRSNPVGLGVMTPIFWDGGPRFWDGGVMGGCGVSMNISCSVQEYETRTLSKVVTFYK